MIGQDKQEMKKLKLKLSELEKENRSLTQKLSLQQKQSQKLNKKEALKYSLILNKQAAKIQKYVKGFLARKKFIKLIEQLKNQKQQSSKQSSTRQALKSVQKQVESKGLTMEMLFRAINQSDSKTIRVDEFNCFFERLKLNVPGSLLKRFTYILDEAFKGQITEKDYLETLVAFGINSEEKTKQLEKNFSDEVIRKFYNKVAQVNLDLQTVFDSQYINYKEFESFMDNSLEGCFQEKEKAMLIKLFDQIEQGYIDKGKIIQRIQQQNSQGKFQVEEEQQNFLIAHDVKEVTEKQKQSETYVMNLFIRKFRKYNKNINFFTDVLAMNLQSNREKVDCEQNSISLHFLKEILNDNFAIILGSDLIDDLIGLLFERDISFRSKFDRQKIMKGDKLKNTSIDIVEFKNKLVQLSNCSEDTSKLLFVLKAIKLDKQELSTKDFIEKYGYSTQRKIEFSDFFILAQKIISANFKEVNSMQERYDKNKTGHFSIAPFIDEINQYRLVGKNQTTADQNQLDSFKRIISKCKSIQSNIIEDFTVYICQNADNISKDFLEKDITNVFQKVFNGKVTQDEIESLWSFMDLNRNSKIEMFEVIDFFVQYFGSSPDIFKIIVKLTGSYLDQKKITTRNFFANYDLYDENVLNKHIFVKKLEIILGVQESHAQIIFEILKNAQDQINIKKFIEEIEKNRKMKSDKIPEKKPSSIELLSKASLNNLDGDTGNKAINKENAPPSQNQLLKSLGIVGQSLQTLIDQKESEIKALNSLVLEYETSSVPILKLKHYLKEIFDKRETFLLLNYIKGSDINRNGFIDKKEWKEFSSNIGIVPLKQKKKLQKRVLKTDQEFYEFVRHVQKEKVIDIDLEFLHQMSEFENLQVNIITIKNILRKNFPESDIGLLMHLLQYFDPEKNGNIQFNDFKSLLIMMDTAEEKADWEPQLFRKYSLNYDKLISKNQEDNLIDIFKSLRYFVKFMSSEDEMLMGKILSKHFDDTGKLTIYYDDFLQKCNYKKSLAKYDKGIKDDQIVLPLKKLRKLLQNADYNEKQMALVLTQIQPSELDILKKILSNDLQEVGKEFRDFVLFFNTGQLMSKFIGKSLFQKQIENKLMKTKSLLKEDNIEILDIGLQKLMIGITKKGMEKIKTLISQFFGSSDTQVNFSKFVQLIKEIQKSLQQDEILKIFEHLDNNHSHTISKDEFIDYIEKNFLEFKKTTSHQELKQAINDSSLKIAQVNMSQAFKNASKQFQEYQIKKEDYFEGKKTIFTNIHAVMKYTSDLIDQLNKKNAKFDDPEFGPIDGDESGAKSLYFEDPIPGGISPDDIIWLRTEQISKEKPPLFLDEGASANDVLQGALGDCWLIGAMSILAQSDDLIYHEPDSKEMAKPVLDDVTVAKLISGIYPKIFHDLHKYGVYVFRFFKNFKWVYVVIDDKIPCYLGTADDPVIVFAKCDSRNEFWVSLTEKAYSKLHGNYWAIVGGQLDDALVDMTGRIAEKIKVKINEKFNVQELKSPADLKKKLQEEFQNKSMLGCSIEKGKNVRGEGKVYKDGQFTGLYSGHAYGLMDIIDLKKNSLVRIRNPWGSGNPIEWNGPWSDQTTELIQNLDEINQQILKKWGEKEAQLVEKENKDGAFLMSWEDFLDQWHNIQICKKFPTNYEGIRFAGQWIGESAGGTPVTPDPQLLQSYVQNPQYIIELSEKTHIFINLSQEDGRLKSKGQTMFPYQGISFYLLMLVFKLDQKEEKLMSYDQRKIMSPLFMKLNRDIQFGLDLEKGKYAIIPSTRNRGEEGDYAMSVYYSCEHSKIKIYDGLTKAQGKQIEEESEQQIVFDECTKAAIKGFISI